MLLLVKRNKRSSKDYFVCSLGTFKKCFFKFFYGRPVQCYKEHKEHTCQLICDTHQHQRSLLVLRIASKEAGEGCIFLTQVLLGEQRMGDVFCTFPLPLITSHTKHFCGLARGFMLKNLQIKYLDQGFE